MLPTTSWFHSADRSILRFYSGHEDGAFYCPPGAVAKSIGISEGHARRRTKTLTEAGLLENEKVYYRITDLGMRYVEGEMDEEELETLNPDA